MLPQVQRISERILKVDNFENVAHVCCDWEEFVFEVAEWGVDHICGVDFDDLSDEAIKEVRPVHWVIRKFSRESTPLQ